MFTNLLMSNPKAVEKLLIRLVEAVGNEYMQPLLSIASLSFRQLAKNENGNHNLLSLVKLSIGNVLVLKAESMATENLYG